tara:strand:+ start:796 stop:1401 length:606 start_codon:yes stop_codon:yes gene_type:complete
MPNWFESRIDVSGKREDVRKFVENVKGSKTYDTEDYEFDFNHFIPQPSNIFRGSISMREEKMFIEKGIPNWYDWNRENWGTKWNSQLHSSDCSVDHPLHYVHTYNISTAWADPRPILHKMIEMYPHLEFEIEGYEESNEYGIYMSTYEDVFLEEQGTMVDEVNNREVYYDSQVDTYRYTDDDTDVVDQEDFYPANRYSWTE